MKKLINNAPTDRQLDALWQKCVKTRAGHVSELSGEHDCLQGHHIFHKPNHRLRWELDFGICLTRGEHFNYHKWEKMAFQKDRRVADDLRAKFLKIRGKTEDQAMILKRQTGGVDKFAVKIYLEQKLKEFEHLSNYTK